jgi:trigger factor
MSVSVEITSSLGRRLTISVPAEKVEETVQNRLQQLARTSKIAGFRPGKIPVSVIKKQPALADRARSEAIETLIQSSLQEALAAEKLHPIGHSTIQSIKADDGMPLEYRVDFDISPEIKLNNVDRISVEKLRVPIEESDIDRVLEQMRKLHALWQEVQRPAQMGDRLTVDLQGLLNGEPIAQPSDKNVFLMLDETTLPPGFAVLNGSKAGDVITIDLQNKTQNKNPPMDQVRATVRAVAEPKLPEIDAAFAKKLGVAEGKIESLRNEVRKHMEQELERFLKNELKQQILDGLVKHHPIAELPKALVDEEYQHLTQDVLAKIKQQNPKLANPQLPKADQEKLLGIAKHRITLGLLFPTIIKENNIKLDQQRVIAQVGRIAGTVENAANIMKTLTSNKEWMERIQTQVLEEQVVEHLLTQVQVTEKTISYAEALEWSKHGHRHHDGHCDHPSHASIHTHASSVL